MKTVPARDIARTILFTLFAILLPAITQASAHQTTITLGVYHFPPIASVGQNGEAEGLLGDLLKALEQTPPGLSFQIVHTSPKRRHLDFDAGLYDVIFFESPQWGWSERPVDVTAPILEDEELYVALNTRGRDASFFENLRQRNIVAISGYHYRLTGYETDTAVLEEQFSIEFSDSHSRNLKLIMADRPSVAEIAIVSESYLQRYLSEHPGDRPKLLIADDPDQRYQLSIIVRKNAVTTADDFLRLLAPLVRSGQYQRLVEKWNLAAPTGLAEGLTER